MRQIRNVHLADAPGMLAIFDYYIKNTVISFEYETPAVSEFEERIRTVTAHYPWLVMEEDGHILGYAYAHPFVGRKAYRFSAELTIYLDKDAKKQGIGRALYEALEARLKDRGITNLYACIGYPEQEDEYLTKNSANFHAHMGFTQVGLFRNCGYKFNRWYHMIWMEKIIGEHKEPMPDPAGET